LPGRWRKKAQLLSVNGVSLDKIPRPAVTKPQGRRFQLLTAGRLIPLKGFDLAIRAFGLFLERLKHEQQGVAAEMKIVGDGPESVRLRAQIEETGLGDRVRLVKWMPREELFREMAESDAFVFASLRDGGGLVVVEAMAAGKPVVCFDLAGPGLHVTEECGIKVYAHSPEQAILDLASAFHRLYSMEALRAGMGLAARKRAEEIYDWSRVAERINRVYLDALRAQPSSEEEPVPARVSQRSAEG
jgi:glycosyltransferase involved in cell wall biosynthesis